MMFPKPCRLPVSLALLALAAATPAAFAAPIGAAVELPGAGRIADVSQTRFRDGFAQRVAYAGAPQNYAEISLRTGEGGDRFGASVPMSKPTQFGIAAELASRFPGQVMRVSTTLHRNGYGPVGLALGSDCLYAWQWIDLQGQRRSRSGGDSLFGASPERAASIRIRLCRTGSATLSDLVRAVESLRLPALGGRSAGPQRHAPEASSRPRPPKAGARPAAEPKTVAARPPGAMDRPSGGEGKGRATRRPGSEGAPDQTTPSVPLPAAQGVPVPYPAGQGAPRYITDALPRQNTPGPVPVPVPAAKGEGPEEALSTDLPSRAYRPPP